MEKIEQAPGGATGTVLSRNRENLPESRISDGWRKPTASHAITTRLARSGAELDVPKARAMIALKRVGTQVGLKSADLMLLDTLGAFSPTQDWEAGRRPIVWPSNASLMEQTGFSLSALKRHIRRLAEVGIISFQDSPNGKRWGHRDHAGHIVEAYGFDLSPLAARAEEFEDLHARLKAERDLCQRLKRQITVSRRMIRARIEAALAQSLDGPWRSLADAFESLLDQCPKGRRTSEELHGLLNLFSTLQDHVEETYTAMAPQGAPVEIPSETPGPIPGERPEMDPKRPDFEPHIQTTNQYLPVICTHADRQPAPAQQKRVPGPRETPKEAIKNAGDGRNGSIPKLATILQTCPEFSTWVDTLDGNPRDWSDMHRIASQLGRMIGITDDVWTLTQTKLDLQQATAALALVFEKTCAGEIASPAGYLRGMVRKAGEGALRLERSFHGRSRRQAA